MRNTRDSCDQMQEEKEDIQGERVLLQYDQLPNENYFEKENPEEKFIRTQPGH